MFFNVFYFSIRVLNALIIVNLYSLSENLKIFNIFESSYDAGPIYSYYIFPSNFFFKLLVMLYKIFCYRSDILFWVLGSEVNKPLV